MVELIIRPNPRIDKDLFLESVEFYTNKVKKPINMRILKIELLNETEEYYKEDYNICLYAEIRTHNIKCKAYEMQNGELDKTKTVMVPASWETIKIGYYVPMMDNAKPMFTIENNHELFKILNYGLQQHKTVQQGNTQGFKNIKLTELKNSLERLDVKVITEDMDGKLVLAPYKGGFENN